jgi:hypothetical protein
MVGLSIGRAAPAEGKGYTAHTYNSISTTAQVSSHRETEGRVSETENQTITHKYINVIRNI